MSIGENIKRRRIDRNMSQAELAEKVGVSENYIYQIECDRKKPSFKAIYIICDVLNSKITEIFEGDKIIDRIKKEIAEEMKRA
jgi:putative transcriptional regulator